MPGLADDLIVEHYGAGALLTHSADPPYVYWRTLSTAAAGAAGKPLVLVSPGAAAHVGLDEAGKVIPTHLSNGTDATGYKPKTDPDQSATSATSTTSATSATSAGTANVLEGGSGGYNGGSYGSAYWGTQ